MVGVAEKNFVRPLGELILRGMILFATQKQGHETSFGPRARNFFRGEPLLIEGKL